MVHGVATLGLPLAARRSTWLAAASLFAFYAATMARDLSLYDSGELALAAVQLGLGHPPGQPLHTLAGFLLSRLPLWPALIGVGLLSALPAALTVVAATSLAETLSGEGGSPRARPLLPWLIAAFGLHEVLWEPATRVEVYALAALCGVWAVARLAAARDAGALFVTGLALGLCASANPMLALCLGLAVAPGVLYAAMTRAVPLRALPLAITGGLAGLSLYLYLPLVAARRDVMVWGAPTDLASLWHYVSLRDYAHNQTIDLPTWLAHWGSWLADALGRWFLPVLVLGALAHLRLAGRTPLGRLAMPLSLLLCVSFVSFNVVFDLEVPDYNGYVALPLWLAIAGVAAWAARAAAPHPYRVAALAVGLLGCVALARPAPWERTRQHDRVARQLADRVLRAAPEGAIVLSLADHFAGTFFYLQEAEHVRPDVVVLAYGLASSSWHWDHLYALHPSLSRFALLGPGGRAGRVRRFLSAHAALPVLVESHELGAQLGLRMCPGGYYLRAGSACDARRPFDRAVVRELSASLARLSEGSPSAHGALASVAYHTGLSLWRVGDAQAALEVLLAGVPLRLLPELPRSPRVAALPAFTAPSPRFLRHAALGDPARNLFLAGAIYAAASEPAASLRCAQAAAADGLPEARALLSRGPRP